MTLRSAINPITGEKLYEIPAIITVGLSLNERELIEKLLPTADTDIYNAEKIPDDIIGISYFMAIVNPNKIIADDLEFIEAGSKCRLVVLTSENRVFTNRFKKCRICSIENKNVKQLRAWISRLYNLSYGSGKDKYED